MTKRLCPGVFCVESQWSDRFDDPATVRPILELLRNQGIIRYAYRDVARVEEFEHYLATWAQKAQDGYPIAYFGFHGEPGCINLSGEKMPYTLEQLGDRFEGKFAGRTLYFASCSTLDVPLAQARALMLKTGANAICGYTKEIDWLESAAFDLTLIDYLITYTRPADRFQKLQKDHRQTWRRLGFRAMWRSGEIWR